ncbi:MAG: hypothetical protein NVS3B20_14870 [Polyangiales bacterium]
MKAVVGNAGAKDTVVGNIAADCRINKFFTALSADALNHVTECLVIQVGGGMGCKDAKGADVVYSGSKDSKGVACRSMKEAHSTPATMGIDDADFNALIEDAAKALATAKVETDDITTLGKFLASTHDDIVQSKATTPSKSGCP